MIDKEKVIKGLETCYCPPSKCEDCPYHDLSDEQSCSDVLCLDALALLKGQEAVKPKIDAFGLPYCPKCKTLVYNTWEFCPHCGQELKWE